MNTAVTAPTLAESETGEQAQSWDAWFHAKVLEALDNTQGYLPHAAAMAEVDRMLAEKRARHAAG